MKLKDTLNLGKTAFPMRAGLPTKEPVWQKEWEDAKLYQRRQELNQGKPHFTLHDGPPYANGNIHVGHAMNKISKISLFAQNLCQVLRTIYPGLGHSWSANRASFGKTRCQT